MLASRESVSNNSVLDWFWINLLGSCAAVTQGRDVLIFPVTDLAPREAKLPGEGWRALREVNISILSVNSCVSLGHSLSIVGLN